MTDGARYHSGMTSPDIWSAFRASVTQDRETAWRHACLEVLRLSGLFDPATYYPRGGTLPAATDPLAHYHDQGWREGSWPNRYFDPVWYAAQNADVAASAADPLLHYVSYGEAEGRRPVAWFDPAWYRAHHDVPPAMHALRHFLLHRCDGSASPIPEFDSAWYLATYRDVAAVGMDPMEHFLAQGFREGRNPSPRFDTRFYRVRYLRGRPDENPLLHYLRHRDEPGVYPAMPLDESTIPHEIRRFTAPGPGFEPVHPPIDPPSPRALALAFYLPQFHPIPENDAWWGTGFTEWTNIARALPRFVGHYQPRIPRDLGHYRLDDPATLARQIALARGAGLGGFVFYFYWFDRRRLLERPLEHYLSDPTQEFPFCLMWANENWTRSWDGSNDDVLIAQSYARDDEAALIATFARHFADPRYLRLHGRPLLMIYRPGLIPQPQRTVARWRRRFRDQHGQDPILVMAQSFGDEDPRRFGLDAAVEFPPHKLVQTLPLHTDSVALLDHSFTAQIYHYDDAVASACAAPEPDYRLIRTAMPGWDNDARRQGRGMVVHGATPARYQQWLDHLIEAAIADPFFGTPLVCINAWNEWAEGAYLEPDQYFGAAFLNATGRALCARPKVPPRNRLLLVGHDAFPAGAQLLLLHIARQLCAVHGLRLQIVLCGGGALEADYRAVAPLHIVADPAGLETLLTRLRDAGSHAVVNSAAAAWCCPVLRAHGFATTLLVHEMPILLTDRNLLAPLASAVTSAAQVVFAAAAVRDAVADLIPLDAASAVILPQGVYQDLTADPTRARALRDAWSIAADEVLAIGIGYADQRKGFDYFLDVFRRAAPVRPGLHMAWVGLIEPATRARLLAEIIAAEATGRFHLTGWRDDIASLLTAADVMLLTSREDPYPSAALEALSLGTPVLAFAGSGGIPARLAARAVVPMGDCAAMAERLCAARPVVAPRAPAPDSFTPYVARLLRLIDPAPSVSVIVTSYRHAPLLPRRLASIFAQTAPIESLTLYDDASDDHSAEAAAAAAAAAGRRLDIVCAERNSGSSFGQWRRAVAAATGDLVWIAEADDLAEPDFLARLIPAFEDPDLLFAFTDSRAIDRDGRPDAADYRASYTAAGGAGALAEDQVYEAAAFAQRFLAERNILFNVSAVLWRRDTLRAALDRLGGGLLGWQVAGDWRVYIELLTTTPGRVAHVAAPLNQHCRDLASASGRLAADRHLAEIGRMHRLIRRRLGHPTGLAARQAQFMAQAAAYLTGR